jgi:hypothetical protein
VALTASDHVCDYEVRDRRRGLHAHRAAPLLPLLSFD